MAHHPESTGPFRPGTVAELVGAHLRRYPLLQLEDLYKLIHQGMLGSEHAVASEQGAREWLAEEISGLRPDAGPVPEEPVLDQISTDGRIVRVHLRPYLAQGGEPEVLLRAFVRTANEHHGDPREFMAAWRAAEALAGTASGPGAAALPATVVPDGRESMAAFFAPLEAAGFPAIHHSQVYERAYRPAYRVVRVDFLRALR